MAMVSFNLMICFLNFFEFFHIKSPTLYPSLIWVSFIFIFLSLGFRIYALIRIRSNFSYDHEVHILWPDFWVYLSFDCFSQICPFLMLIIIDHTSSFFLHHPLMNFFNLWFCLHNFSSSPNIGFFDLWSSPFPFLYLPDLHILFIPQN